MDDCITLPLGFPELHVLDQHREDGQLVVEVAYRTGVGICPRCGHPSPKVHDRRAQDKRDLPLGDQPVTLRLWRRRFRCLWCHRPNGRAYTFSEPNLVWGLGPGGRARRTTPRLRQRLAQEVPHQTVKRLAQVYRVGPRFVETCFASHRAPPVHPATGRTPRVLGLDEFALRRGQRYDTLVCDLALRQVLEVLEGRAGPALQPDLEQVPDPDRVQVVVIDMSEAFRQEVQLCLPRACIVVDRFHAVRRVGQALDQVRRRVQQADRELAALVYQCRYRLLQDPATWTAEGQAEIETVLAALPDLQAAWEHFRAFQDWYALPDRAHAERALVAWEARLRERGLHEFAALQAPGSLLGRWREDLLNYFDHRFTNAFVEGKHTRTKQLIRQAYGYRNRNNLRLRILTSAA